jgi:hypothetical protein
MLPSAKILGISMPRSVVGLTLLYVYSKAVIPTPISIGINFGGNPAHEY